MSKLPYTYTRYVCPDANHADNRTADDIERDLYRKLTPNAIARYNRLPRVVRHAMLANIADGIFSIPFTARQLADPTTTFNDLPW